MPDINNLDYRFSFSGRIPPLSLLAFSVFAIRDETNYFSAHAHAALLLSLSVSGLEKVRHKTRLKTFTERLERWD